MPTFFGGAPVADDGQTSLREALSLADAATGADTLHGQTGGDMISGGDGDDHSIAALNPVVFPPKGYGVGINADQSTL